MTVRVKVPLLLLSMLILSLAQLSAQIIINTERMRINSQEEGIHGSLNLGASIRRNKAGQYVEASLLSDLEYFRKRHRVLMLGSYLITRFNPLDEPDREVEVFTNNAYGHFRYNYQLNDWLVMELFSQVQRNVIQQINLRYLNGGGLRFQIVRQDSLYLNIGSIYMYEYEHSTDGDSLSFFLRHHRWSNYISFGFQPSPTFHIRNVAYYQPRFDKFRDFRFTDELNLGFALTRYFSFEFYFLWVFDEFPPPGVPKLAYAIRNGFKFSF